MTANIGMTGERACQFLNRTVAQMECSSRLQVRPGESVNNRSGDQKPSLWWDSSVLLIASGTLGLPAQRSGSWNPVESGVRFRGCLTTSIQRLQHRFCLDSTTCYRMD